MPATQEIMKQNASNTPPIDTPLSSPTLSLGQDTTMLHFILQFIEAVKRLTAIKALPNSASVSKTTKALTIGEPKPKEVKL